RVLLREARLAGDEVGGLVHALAQQGCRLLQDRGALVARERGFVGPRLVERLADALDRGLRNRADRLAREGIADLEDALGLRAVVHLSPPRPSPARALPGG